MKYRALNSIKFAGIIIGVALFFIFFIGIMYRYANRHEPTVIGTSFSLKQANYLGIEPQQALKSITEDLGIRHLRLMSYWDLHQPTADEYDFNELDWQIKLAEQQGARVTLALGQRQPRWPECHIPDWALKLDQDNYESALLEYIAVVVQRYGSSPAIESYQLENEAANRSFGKCPYAYDRDLLKRELAVVTSSDSNTPVTINASNQSGIPLFGAQADRVGFSIYKTANFEYFGRNWQYNFWYVPSWWHGFRATVVEATGRKTFIHELQAEPWGPNDIKSLSKKEQSSLMSPQDIIDQVAFAQGTGMHTVYLWGSEWWLWRHATYNDSTYLDTVHQLTTTTP